ncbi:hypothetical protein SUNI508_03561 [Seiridium unicorne]|uniref:Uncharacterized protein n=1 Tax=Seiridium unicorne TaxID=138068 RepID=A0ABR2VCN8_9PEZI
MSSCSRVHWPEMKQTQKTGCRIPGLELALRAVSSVGECQSDGHPSFLPASWWAKWKRALGIGTSISFQSPSIGQVADCSRKPAAPQSHSWLRYHENPRSQHAA